VAVTPNNGTQDGTTVFSNFLEIIDYTNPNLTSVILNSTSFNLTSDNLTAYPVNASGYMTLIYDWREDNTSVAVLNMPFDTNVSTNDSGAVRDYSTNTYNGTLGSGTDAYMPTWISSGISGGAYSFDGVDDYINLSDVFNDVYVPFSITAWINVKANTSIDPIVSSDDNDIGNYRGFWMVVQPDNQIQISYGDGTGSGGPNRRSGTTTEFINNNTWTFVSAVVEGPTDMRLYINDTNATVTYTGSSNETMVHNVWPALIGSRGRQGPFFMNGSIDELQVYNHSLSHEQIKTMYNSGAPRYNLTVSQETTLGDNWSVAVTPNNVTQDGTTVFSNFLEIVTADGGTPGGNGGGGGGGIITYPVFYPTQEELEQGYEKALRKNWTIQIEFNGENYTIKIDSKTRLKI
jgi:hypothetical protein